LTGRSSNAALGLLVTPVATGRCEIVFIPPPNGEQLRALRSNSSAGAHQRKRAAAVALNIFIRRKPESIHSRLVAKRERKGWTSAFAGVTANSVN
jgi:hypothetical protein